LLRSPEKPEFSAVRDIALEFAKEIDTGNLAEWQLCFRLAKRLRGLSEFVSKDVFELRPALEIFCETLSTEGIGNFVDFSSEAIEERWIEFLDAWEKVRIPDGTGPLEVAFARAKWRRIVPTFHISEDFSQILSTAFHLQQLQGSEPILLPVEHVGKLLERDKMHASRIVQMLVRLGFLEVVDPNFSYKRGRAKRYRFVFDATKYKEQRVTHRQ
jgi:hypothetical protein